MAFAWLKKKKGLTDDSSVNVSSSRDGVAETAQYVWTLGSDGHYHSPISGRPHNANHISCLRFGVNNGGVIVEHFHPVDKFSKMQSLVFSSLFLPFGNGANNKTLYKIASGTAIDTFGILTLSDTINKMTASVIATVATKSEIAAMCNGLRAKEGPLFELILYIARTLYADGNVEQEASWDNNVETRWMDGSSKRFKSFDDTFLKNLRSAIKIFMECLESLVSGRGLCMRPEIPDSNPVIELETIVGA